MKYISVALASVLLIACTSTETTTQTVNTGNELIDAELMSDKWRELKRFPPRYPNRQASVGKQGCATIKYTITPDYQITDVEVVDATHDNFANEAKKVIGNWKWSLLPEGILKTPVKTQTRFEYCIEKGDGHCAADKLAKKSACRGKDVIASVGF